MKHFALFRIVLVLMMTGLFVTSCMMDWYPIDVVIRVQDESGNDRLDPGSEHFIGENVTLDYNGDTYRMEIPTKVYFPHFSGLKLEKAGDWLLRFGELDGGQNHDDTFTIHWPDGTKDVITFHRTIMTPLIVIDTWRLNGKKTELPIVIEK